MTSRSQVQSDLLATDTWKPGSWGPGRFPDTSVPWGAWQSTHQFTWFVVRIVVYVMSSVNCKCNKQQSTISPDCLKYQSFYYRIWCSGREHPPIVWPTQASRVYSKGRIIETLRLPRLSTMITDVQIAISVCIWCFSDKALTLLDSLVYGWQGWFWWTQMYVTSGLAQVTTCRSR